MNQSRDVVKKALGMSAKYFIATAIGAIVVGLIMLFYPGGTMKLLDAAFIIFQALITIFIIIFTISAAMSSFDHGSKVSGVLSLIIGALAVIFVWAFSVNVVYFIVAAFLILSGAAEIYAGFRIAAARYFLILLGIVNILVGVIIIRNPVVLPLLIAWYLLFWGISRLFLGMELKKVA
jgi:uncharacterized membrane protein HdeD (DUF308 family)